MSFCVIKTPENEKFIEKQRNKLRVKSIEKGNVEMKEFGNLKGFDDDGRMVESIEEQSESDLDDLDEYFNEMDFGNRIWSISLFPFYSVGTGMECAAVSVKNHPLKLVNLGNMDAVTKSKSKTTDRDTGNVAFTYSTKDHFDEVSSPFSTAFNLNGSHLYCGFMDNNFQVFDINYRDPIVNTNLSPTRKSKAGLKGILSCISFNPDYSGIYAVGSFSGGIGLYDERNNDCFFILDSTSFSKKRKGVSSLSFSPCGNYLYSRYRESTSPGIQVWDIRSSKKVVRELVLAPRSSTGPQPPPLSLSGGKSNQRLGFSVDRETGLVAAGFHDGRVGVWGLDEEKEVYEFDVWKDKKYSVACHSVHLLDSTSPALSYVSKSRRILEMEGQETRSLRSASSAPLSLACFFQERVFLDNDQDEDGLGHVNDDESIYYEKGATAVFTNL